MELNWIRKTVKFVFFVASCCFLVGTLFFDLSIGLSLLFGALWGCVNLLLIEKTANSIFTKKSYLKFFLLVNLKFPFLYYLGYLFLKHDYFSIIAIGVGFSLTTIGIFFTPILHFLIKKNTLFAIALLSSMQLQASLEGEVSEVPSFITFIYKAFHDAPWAKFLREWDTLFFSFLVATLLSLFFYFGTRKATLIPSGLQNFLEWVAENLRYFVLDILGPAGERYVPFLGTIFIYILCMNWMVLVPFMKSPTSNINITAALAICVFCLVQYLNIRNYGILGFLYHLAGSPKSVIQWVMVPLMLPIEMLTQLTRPLTLALRLFGNVVGEDILIGAFALFGISFFINYNYPIFLPLQIPFMFLALLTGLMQALVFSLLSTIYILLSIPIGEDAH